MGIDVGGVGGADAAVVRVGVDAVARVDRVIGVCVVGWRCRGGCWCGVGVGVGVVVDVGVGVVSRSV